MCVCVCVCVCARELAKIGRCNSYSPDMLSIFRRCGGEGEYWGHENNKVKVRLHRIN